MPASSRASVDLPAPVVPPTDTRRTNVAGYPVIAERANGYPQAGDKPDMISTGGTLFFPSLSPSSTVEVMSPATAAAGMPIRKEDGN